MTTVQANDVESGEIPKILLETPGFTDALDAMEKEKADAFASKAIELLLSKLGVLIENIEHVTNQHMMQIVGTFPASQRPGVILALRVVYEKGKSDALSARRVILP